MFLALVAYFAFLAPIYAESIFVSPFGGLNDSIDSALIEKGQCQNCLNVELNKNGTAVRKRDGFAHFQTLPISTQQVSGSFGFKDASGNEQLLYIAGTRLARITNQATAVDITTRTNTARLSCVAANGKAYCFTSSADLPFSYDGTTFANLTANSFPQGKTAALTTGRMVVIGVSGQTNRAYFSKSGDLEEFDTANTPDDAWTEDIGTPGDVLTAVAFLNGRVIFFKEYSITGANCQDQFNCVFYDISSEVGVAGPESLIHHEGRLYFKSSDNRFYEINGNPGGISHISLQISSTTASILSGKSRQNIQTTKADFDAGNLTVAGPGAPMSTTITDGSVQPSSVTLVDVSTHDFNQGTHENTWYNKTGQLEAAGAPTVFVTTYTASVLPASDNPTWTKSTSGSPTESVSASTLTLVTASNEYIWYSRSISTASDSGNITLIVRKMVSNNTSGINGIFTRFLDSGGNNLAGVLVTNRGTATYTTGGTSQQEDVGNSFSTFTVIIDTASIGIWRNGVLKASGTVGGAISTIRFGADSRGTPSGQAVTGYYDFLYYATDTAKSPGFASLGISTYTSRIFDTAYSTPIGGAFSSTFSAPGGTSLTFQVRDSTSPNNDQWTDWTAITTTGRSNLNRRYQQFRAILTPMALSTGPYVDDIGLTAATTGQFIIQCVQPGTGISAWGSLESAGGLTCGSQTFAVSTGTTCTDVGTSFTNQSTGTTIGIATAQAFKVRVTYGLDSASCTARTDSITINWTEGAVSSPTFGAYWNDGLYWTVQTSGTMNNRILKYDLLNKAWFPFDIAANALLNFNNILYFGNVTSGKVYKYSNIKQSEAPTSDDGSNINAYWKSKDFAGPDPFTEQNWDNISLVLKKQTGGTATVDWQTMGGNTNSGSYTVQLSTGQNVVRNNYALPFGQRSSFFNVQVGNNSTNPFEIIGIKIDHSPLEWRVLPPD